MVAKLPFATAFGTVILALSTVHIQAQAGLVNDVLQGVAKAGKAAKAARAARAGRIAADVTDGAGRLLKRLPASSATRKAFGLGLPTAAADAFEVVPSATGRLRVYLGVTDDGLKDVPDPAKPLEISSASRPANLGGYVADVRAAGHQIEGVDYVVETDVLAHDAPRFDVTDRVFLANYGGNPWPVRTVGSQSFAAEVTPSLLVKISEESVADAKHLFDLSFDPHDLRVGSFFDEGADVESVEALRKAAGKSAFKNIGTAEEALEFVGRRRGKIVALVGHVEDQHFVVAGLADEKFRVSISSLLEAAERSDVSLLLLGCDTAGIRAGGGIAGRINSVSVASQLRNALTADTYAAFLSSIGTSTNPLVVSREVIGQAQVIVATRLRLEARGQRAGVVSVQASPKLALLQSQNAAQTFRGVPPWLDNILVGGLGLTTWALLISTVVSISKRSLSPIKTTTATIFGLLLLPFFAVKWLLNRTG